MKIVEPKVFIIGESVVLEEGLQAMLDSLGVPEWNTDAKSDAEMLSEVAGKLCYMSFDTDLNENLTRTGTRNNHDYLQQGIIATKHGCYDGDTDVLTASGWKSWPDVTEDDLLATRTAEGRLEYHKPLHLIAAPYSGRMYMVEGRGVDLFVTDNHNLLVCKTTTRDGRKKEKFSLIQAADLGHVSHAYVKTAQWDVAEDTPAPRWALLGFAIGDAHYREGVLMFSLHRDRKIAYLQTLCAQLKWELRCDDEKGKYRVTVPVKFQALFSQIYTEDGDKQIPPGTLISLGRDSLIALFHGLMEADGHKGATGDTYDTTSQVLAGQIQQLCLHIGLAANVCYTYSKEDGRREGSFGSKPLTRLSIIRRELKPEINKYAGSVGRSQWVDGWEGMVYCAEVPNNTLYVRRNGIPVWCGNSVLEHTVVNFVLLDVSRVLTHELVRHGDGTAFSQESGRYVRRELGMFIPDIVRENPQLFKEFVKAAEAIEDNYTKLVALSGINEATDFGWKKKMTSALRRILPEGRANAIFFSANHRALRHIIQMRTDRHAEEEVRKAFVPVFYAMLDRYPAIYADGRVEVVDGIEEVKFDHEKV